MSKLLNTNELFGGGSCGDSLLVNPHTFLKYTENVQLIAVKTKSYWFLDVIASYQKKLKGEGFQVWKLEREYAGTLINGTVDVVQRKTVFNVVCDDGNENILVKQNIPFSDFEHDIYVLWVVDGVALLPSEY